MRIHDRPFIGSEALTSGLVKKHQLRSEFRSVFPDVYVDGRLELTLRRRIVAGWLWSHREGVIAGLSASAIHGAKWVADDSPIELIWPNARRPTGLRTFDYRLERDEFGKVDGMFVTTPARTAFELGRRSGLDGAVARLDALGNATGLTASEVVAVAQRHRGARGLRQLATALDLYDPGAESPRETWLRLLLMRAGFPRLRTQIPVVALSGNRYRVDMGWEDIVVGIEYDGDQHRVDGPQFRKDIIRMEELRELGWIIVRVIAGTSEADIVDRVRRARASKLRGDREIA